MNIYNTRRAIGNKVKMGKYQSILLVIVTAVMAFIMAMQNPDFVILLKAIGVNFARMHASTMMTAISVSQSIVGY